MFIKDLNKEESKVFITLVKLLAKVDEEFADKEKELIDGYIKELSLNDDVIEKIDLETALIKLNPSSERIKSIIYFELVGLALADGLYEKEEIEFLNKVAESFKITKEKAQNFLDYFKEVKDMYDIACVDYENKIELLKKKAEDLLK